MVRFVLLTGVLLMTGCAAASVDSPFHLRVGEGFVDPIGYHDPTPVFSWVLPKGVIKQTAYRIEVKDEEVLWDSGWVESDQSVLVPYGGEPLASRQRVSWRVQCRVDDGKETGWSEPARSSANTPSRCSARLERRLAG